jgi:hypothetical protein
VPCVTGTSVASKIGSSHKVFGLGSGRIEPVIRESKQSEARSGDKSMMPAGKVARSGQNEGVVGR